MSRSSYPDTIINQYESDISTWEHQLQELEEQAKDLSLEDSEDRTELVSTAREMVPEILDAYTHAKNSRTSAEQLQEKLEYVLDNPGVRYPNIPDSLDKHEEMTSEISELDELFYRTEERHEFLSYTLDDEVGFSFETYGSGNGIPDYVTNVVAGMRNHPYVIRLQEVASEHPEATFAAGILVGGSGIVAGHRIWKRLQDTDD